MALKNDDMQRLARLGAQARLEELDRERTALLRAFPGLRRFAGRAAGSEEGEGGAATPKRRRRRSKMSPAQRKAVSERMKKYWADRRNKKK